jgi:aminopeptidase N
MKFTLAIFAILLTASQLSFAQESAQKYPCASVKNKSAAKATVMDAAEENYDVKYLKLDLALTNQSVYIKGTVTTNAKTVVASFATYVFELDSALIIDTVLINGLSRPFTTAGDLRSVTLSSALGANTMFTAVVKYHGTPSTSGTIFSGIGGINNMVSPSWGTRVTFTQSESYHAKEWWPCKQSLHDKIDSMDMWITVPDSMKAGSNGVLKAVTRTDSTHLRYEWKERFPIDYYLISASIAPYIDYSYYMHFTGSTDSMLVQNYVYPNPLTLPFFKSVIDSTGMMVDYLSALYGRYPFWQEKYGHCMAPLNGGMEHQTMTTIGFFEGWVVAHELGHQWFGDNATCGTWADIFMNEGLASYTEDLFIDHFHSHALFIDDMIKKQTDVLSVDTGSVFCDDTTSENRIFDGRLSYHKGACVLHMLRYLVNNDSTFFSIYRTYQQNFKNSTGTIADFANTVKTVAGPVVNGVDIDTFFNQWAYQQGYPTYSIYYNQVGTDITLRVDQFNPVVTSVPFFTTPLEILVHSSFGDTTVKILNNVPGQIIHFNWSKTMTTALLDPSHWLLYKLVYVAPDTTLVSGIKELPVTPVKIYPNPTSENWTVEGLPANSTLALSDVAGRVLWTGKNSPVPAENFSKGLYLLTVTNDDGKVATYKLIKL